MVRNRHPVLVPLTAFFAVVAGGVALLSEPNVSEVHGGTDAPSVREVEDWQTRLGDWPSFWEVSFEDPRARGWRQVGKIPSPIDVARKEVDAVMRERGFVCRHDVGEADGHGRMLVLYEGGGLKILWSLWVQEWNRTGFAWGISK